MIAVADIIAARKFLVDAKAPSTERRFVYGSQAEADLLNTEAFTNASAVGDNGTALKEASLGRKYGLDFYCDQNVQKTTAETANYTPSIAFHKNAFALVTRQLEMPLGAPKAFSTSYDGFGLRVVQGYDQKTKTDTVSIDMLCGVKTLSPELAAVITDSAAHHKYPINDFALIPDYAVLDPELTRGLPPMLTATTGMDALTHAIEAYIGRSTTKLTRAMSEEAATRIVRSLYTAYENGGDMQARADMLRAAYCAGVSFTRSYVGYVHGVAHSLGGQYGVPHGLANAVILPYFLDAYGAACHKKLGRLARIAGVASPNASDSEAAEAFIRWIRETNAKMGIPETIPQIRTVDIPEMAHHAAKESNPLYPVPVLMDEGRLAQMYLKLMPAKEENA